MSDEERVQQLQKRLERERRARFEAEAIAERVTSDLYSSQIELRRLNDELGNANQELQAVNQALRDFVAIASHDLRTPLTSILGFAVTMRRRWSSLKDEDKVEYLEIIEREGRHLSRMVDDLLTISRIEAGALDTRAQVVELRRAIDEVIEGFGGAEIRVSMPPDLSVLVDADHLQRMLVNFVGNALKYGAPPIEVEAFDDGEWAEIRVRDLGDGVPADFVPRLFNRFARADAASGKTGTGLGLSIVQGLAQANGGDTWYEPNEPRGSCFAIRLPKSAA